MKVVDDPSVSGRNEEMNSLLAALSGLLKGDASVRLPLHWSGVSGKVADAFNAVVQQNADMADELIRLVSTMAVGPGDSVVVPTPTFAMFSVEARLAGAGVAAGA